MGWKEFDSALDRVAAYINSSATTLDDLIADVGRHLRSMERARGITKKHVELEREKIGAMFVLAFKQLDDDVKRDMKRDFQKHQQ